MKQTEITYKTPEYPRQIRLDTTTACNAKCPSCHRFLSERHGMMPIDMICKILDDVATWPVPLTEIIPVNYGEFFLRPDWYLILNMITTRLPKTQITIPTNGSLLTGEIIDKLCKIPTVKLINFSINAFFDETYEAFMGFHPATKYHIENAAIRIKLQRPAIKIWASMVFDPAYQSDLERDYFKEYWKTKVDAVWCISASSANRPAKVMVIPRTLPCRSIFSDLVIGYDGKLSSCCWDAAFSLDLGFYSLDAHKDWHNPQLTEMRRLHNEHKRNDIPLCKECTSA